jgi:protein subunit release factor A
MSTMWTTKGFVTALGKLRTEKNMIKEIKQASAPPKLAHSYDFGKIDLVPDAAVGGKLHESNYKVAVLPFADCEQT